MNLNPRGMKVGKLSPSATYAERQWVWMPADQTHPDSDRHYGNVTLMMRKTFAPGAKVDAAQYAIEEDEPMQGVAARVFLLTNLTTDDGEEPYRVVVGRYTNCTCKAGRCRNPCKHGDIVAELIRQDLLGNPFGIAVEQLRAVKDSVTPLEPDDDWPEGF